MEGMNKFKVLTVAVIFMFLFAVAAIYTNTKDASQGKLDVKNKAQAERLKKDIKSDVANSSVNSQNLEDVIDDLSDMNKRVNSLSDRIDDLEIASKPVCRVYGVVSDDEITQLSVDSAISEAKDNGKELVMTCSF